MIKAFNNEIINPRKVQYYDGSQTNGRWDAVLVANRSDEVTAKAYAGGSTYNEEADVAADSADAALTPGTYTASADGFGGPVEVTVEVGSDGSIADVSIIGESETPEIGGAAIPELKKAALASQSADIDSVSGASLTSGAVKAALADALAQAAGGAGAADAQADGNEESGAAKAADGKKFIAGTYTATSTGFGGDIDVTVTVTEDEITDVEITGDHETENIGSFAVDMLGDRILEACRPAHRCRLSRSEGCADRGRCRPGFLPESGGCRA